MWVDHKNSYGLRLKSVNESVVVYHSQVGEWNAYPRLVPLLPNFDLGSSPHTNHIPSSNSFLFHCIAERNLNTMGVFSLVMSIG